ncbi:MAG TPA: cellulase family glycosylhydrolase [Candidatus Doudnabacteria bacterium]|nr:cellulase family glycosylhydrolase [Candidatus Doudnabacteria bacterium]
MKKHLKSLGYIFGALICLVIGLSILGYVAHPPEKDLVWGVNYSQLRAKDLNMDPIKLFTTILDDLQVKDVRLAAYWSEIEETQGEYNFNSIKSLLDEAQSRDVNVILAVGRKLPRWPECHEPAWYHHITMEQKEEALLAMIEKTVTELKTYDNIVAWQVENEPFFDFGLNCPIIKSSLYKKEVALVKSLDDRPIIGTDSGEKGPWITTAWGGIDIFGSTMYRTVYLDKKEKYTTYPLPAWTYNVKAGLLRILSGANKTLGVELQAEPWFAGVGAQQTPEEIQQQLMNPSILQANTDYATRTGFSENYFWGTEWWYWYAETTGDTILIDTVKPLFK